MSAKDEEKVVGGEYCTPVLAEIHICFERKISCKCQSSACGDVPA